MNGIVHMTGLSFETAGVVFNALGWVTWASALVSLTGVGFSAAALLIASRHAILRTARARGRNQALQL
ncbi:MAG: hypothetical protein QM632_04750 [Micrococcaceae bacterium]